MRESSLKLDEVFCSSDWLLKPDFNMSESHLFPLEFLKKTTETDINSSSLIDLDETNSVQEFPVIDSEKKTE